jgi:hypothetical protein
MRNYIIPILILLITLSRCSGTYDLGGNSTTTWDDSLYVSEIYEYEEFSNKSKKDFKMILEEQSVDSTSKLFGPEIVEENYNVIRIRYDGRIVEIRHQRRNQPATCLVSLNEVSSSEASNSGFTNYSPLSQEQQKAIRSGVNGSNSCYHPTNYPLRSVEIVQYNGTYYSLETGRSTVPMYSYRIVNSSSS